MFYPGAGAPPRPPTPACLTTERSRTATPAPGVHRARPWRGGPGWTEVPLRGMGTTMGRRGRESSGGPRALCPSGGTLRVQPGKSHGEQSPAPEGGNTAILTARPGPPDPPPPLPWGAGGPT